MLSAGLAVPDKRISESAHGCSLLGAVLAALLALGLALPLGLALAGLRVVRRGLARCRAGSGHHLVRHLAELVAQEVAGRHLTERLPERSDLAGEVLHVGLQPGVLAAVLLLA